ncbi:MAG: hypothetical protein LAP85_08945 [Acidobacteriia bacterium]|nr:hypothetical protein [Terriglobia bacterium]
MRFILRAMIVEEVLLAAIDFEDETFRISEDLDLARMCPSLQAAGLIHAVILLEGTVAPGYRIVCGFRRLHGLRRLGRTTAAARILRPAEFGKLEVFLKAIWDNLSHRQLCPLETARVLYTLKHECGVESEVLIERFLPLLGLSPHRNVLRTYLTLHALHPELRILLNAGHLTLSSAERLAGAAPETQAGLASILGKIRLSASLQRETLDLVEDLTAIGRTTPAEVLSQPEILAAASDARISAFQRGEKIHGLLYRQRNPRISQAIERFHSEKAGLNLPGTVRLSPDPFFESPRLRVEFDVASAQAFRETVAALERACRTTSLDRLFEIA